MWLLHGLELSLVVKIVILSALKPASSLAGQGNIVIILNYNDNG